MKPKTSLFSTRSKAAALASAVTLCVAGYSQAFEINWNTTTGDFSTASNWLVGAGPGTALPTGSDNANIANGGTSQYTANAPYTVGEVRAGNGAAGKLEVSGGSTFTSTNLYVGRQNGAALGTLTVSGAATNYTTPAGGLAFIGSGSPDIGTAGAGATGVLNITSGATFNYNQSSPDDVQALRFGDARGQTSGTYKGTLNVDGGTLNLPNARLYVGVSNTSSVGEVNVLNSGNININNSYLVIGKAGLGTLNLSGGSITKEGGNQVVIADNAGTGTVNHTGGNLAINSGELWIGNSNGSTATYNLSGTGTATVNNWIAVGRLGATGVLNISGGTLTKTGNNTNNVTIGTDGGANQGTVNVTGGLFDVQAGEIFLGEGSLATMNLSASGEVRTPSIKIAVNNTANLGVLNLNGGTLKTGRIYGGAGNSAVEFNGTTIQATSSQTLFLDNLDLAEIKSGGAIIDTNGFDLGTGAFQSISGTGGLTKNGAGTLSLLGANTFSGPVTVNAGKLITTTASSPAYNPTSGAVTVANSASLGLNVLFYADAIQLPSLTFGSSTSLDLNLGAAGTPASVTGAPIVLTGALSANSAAGTIPINLTGTNLATGQFPVIQYGTSITSSVVGGGFTSFKVGTLPLGVTAQLVNNTANHSIDLKITVKSPVWTGKISGAWNTTVKNWENASDAADVAFADGDPVLFADLIPEADPFNPQYIRPTTTNVTLASGVTVKPGTVVLFNNSVLDYTLAGAGKISNPTGSTVGLTKQGTANLTISTPNDFTGVVRLEGGTLNVATLANGGVASPIGAGSSAASSLVLAGGILNYTGVTTNLTRSFTIGGAEGGIGVDNAATNLTVAVPFTATAGGFVKKGAGTLTITTPGTNTLAAAGGITHIDGGKIVINGTGAATAQVINNGGDVWVGATTASAGQLDVTNTTLTVGGWLAIGRGNGDGGNISTMNVTGSTVTVANLSMGYANGLANLATQNLNIAGSTFNNTGTSAIAENGGSTSNITATTGAILNLGVTNMAIAGAATANLTLTGNAIVNTRNLLTALGGNTSASTITIGGTSAMNVGIPTNTAFASIGRDGGTGTLTVKENGSFIDTNDFTLGEINGNSGKGILNIQDSATVTTGTVYIGRGTTNTGTVNQTGGTFSNADLTDLQIGSAGTGTWDLSAGTVNCSGWTSVGNGGGSTGILKVSGGTFNQTRTDRGIVVGDGGTGTANLSGTGIVNSAADLRIGWSGTANGTVTQTGGTANIPANVILGNSGSAQGTYNLSAGTLNLSTNTGFNLIVGNADTAKGTLNVSGTGAIKLDNNASILLGNGNTSGDSTVTQTGGTITAFSDVGTTVGGTGGVVLGSATATGANTYNLSGGTLTVAKVSSAGSRSYFNFKGGTLKAVADSTSFVSGLTLASIEGGGANIDSNGHNVTITTALVDAGGGGGVTKTGTGTLTLAGVNTYLGNTVISAGTLALADNAALRFFIGANGVTNHVTGTGAATLDGDFNIETTGAAIASGNSWTLVDNSVNKTYGASFSVIGFTGSNHVWTKVDGTRTWTFSEATGALILTVGTGTAYNTWTNSYFPGVTDPAIIGPAADPDHDGNSNALEFALGGVPNSGSDGPKVYAIQADSTADADTDKEQLLTIAVRTTVTPAFVGSPSPVANTSDGLTAYTIQGSLDLAGFATVVTPVTPAVTTGLPAAPAGYEYRTFSLNGSNGLTGKGFLRVKVN